MDMVRIESARLWIFVYREGALSPVGHDLRLSVTGLDLESDGASFRVEIDLSTLRVDGAMRGDRLDPLALDEGERRQILANLHASVLDVDRHPEARYQGTVTPRPGGFLLQGDLELEGRRRPLTVRVENGKVWRGEVVLTPSAWGVRRYRAMLGALRTADRVAVRFEIDPPAALRDAAAPRAATEAS